MWIIDIRHWLDETQTGPGVPQLRSKVQALLNSLGAAENDITAAKPEENKE